MTDMWRMMGWLAVGCGILVFIGCVATPGSSNTSGTNDYNETNTGDSNDSGESNDSGGSSDTGGSSDPNTGVDHGNPTYSDQTLFPPASIWYTDISQTALDPQSAEVIAWLDAQGGWGLGRMQIDFSLEVLEADADTPMMSFVRTDDWYDPDCDFAQVPMPLDGVLEGEDGYACESDGDCHLIVIDRATEQLFEMWRANIVSGTFEGGCLAIWDLTQVYDPSGRGENCTSADAAGYPIAPLLVTADEVATGEVNHALRFILPNARIRHGVYLHPATHSTGATSGGSAAPPYGTRLRLRADYPLETLPNEAARIVARAMQKHGMFLADGGSVALTFQSDRYTIAKWDALLGPRDLDDLQVTDFEMVDGGERFPYTGDCVRN